MSSSSGYASIVGIAILSDPRNVPQSKSTMFDAEIYIGSPGQPSILGALRYFNQEGRPWGGVGMYFIYAQACCLLSWLLSKSFHCFISLHK